MSFGAEVAIFGAITLVALQLIAVLRPHQQDDSETNKWGQRFYEKDATRLFPAGCKCPDRSGSCDWCRVYYNGPDEELEARP